MLLKWFYNNQDGGMDWIDLVGRFCECGNEPSCFIKCGEYFDQLSNYQLLKKVSAPRNQLPSQSVSLVSHSVSLSQAIYNKRASSVYLAMHMSWSETLAEEMNRYFQESGIKKKKKHFLLLVFRNFLPCYPPHRHPHKCCLAHECTNK